MQFQLRGCVKLVANLTYSIFPLNISFLLRPSGVIKIVPTGTHFAELE